MINIDLKMLENDKRFEEFCFRLALYEFPKPALLAGSWDGGRDIVNFNNSDDKGDIVWQCKFITKGISSSLKNKIEQSLDSLDKNNKIQTWILCIPIDASGSFYNWLRKVLANYPFIEDFQIWDQRELLRRLEKHRDIFDTFFYRQYRELEQYFRTDELELIGFEVDQNSPWIAHDPKVLYFSRTDKTRSDIVFDIIVQNKGTIESLLREIKVELIDVQRVLHGFPEEALLFSKFTYAVSLHNGEQGVQFIKLEPPLRIKAGSHERFNIQCIDVGYAWRGALRFILKYGENKELPLPWVRIYT